MFPKCCFQPRFPKGSPGFFFIGFGQSLKGEVAAHRIGEDGAFLENNGEQIIESSFRQCGCIHAIDKYAALVRLIQTAQELHQGGFPGAVYSKQGNFFAGFYFQVKVLIYFLFSIRKAYIPEFNFSRLSQQFRRNLSFFIDLRQFHVGAVIRGVHILEFQRRVGIHNISYKIGKTRDGAEIDKKTRRRNVSL